VSFWAGNHPSNLATLLLISSESKQLYLETDFTRKQYLRAGVKHWCEEDTDDV